MDFGFDDGAHAPGTNMLGDALEAQIDSDPGILRADERALTGQAPGHRVLIPIETNAKGRCDRIRVEVVCIERAIRQGFEATNALSAGTRSRGQAT